MKGVRFFILAMFVLSTGCGSDDTTVAPITKTTPTPSKHAVLSLLFSDFENAYKQRDLAGYEEIIDDQFVFHLAQVDVAQGHPSQWARAQEMEYTGDLFNPAYEGGLQCDSVYFDFQFPDPHGIELYTFHPASAPNETWYSTVLGYTYYFRFGPSLAIASGTGDKIKLTIRNAGTESRPYWKFVQIDDYGPYGIPTQTSMKSETLQWSFGAAKSVYAPVPQQEEVIYR